MDDDKLSFLDDKPTDPNAATEAAQAADQAPIETPEVVEETQVTPQREDHNPLLPKYLDTYNELRDAKRRIAEFEEAQKSKAEMPDPLLDPEGYRAVQQQEFESKLWDATARTSEIAARRYYGPEVVAAAFEALKAQSDPLLGQYIRRSADPWDAIVQWHQRETMLADIGNDPNEWAVRNGYVKQQAPIAEGQAPPAQTQQRTSQIPAASLSRAPASKKASDVPVGPGNAFDATFGH